MSYLSSSFPFTILANQLPDLPAGPELENVRGPVEISQGYTIWQITLAALVVLVVAGVLFWLYRNRRKKDIPAIDPKEAALAEIEAASLASEDEQFAMLYADAVRRFISSRFDIPATSQTSAQVCAGLPLREEEKTEIRAFLERCDGVKFAGQSLNPEARKQLLDTANQLIEHLDGKEPA